MNNILCNKVSNSYFRIHFELCHKFSAVLNAEFCAIYKIIQKNWEVNGEYIETRKLYNEPDVVVAIKVEG